MALENWVYEGTFTTDNTRECTSGGSWRYVKPSECWGVPAVVNVCIEPEERKDDEKMRYLYEVYIVDPVEDRVIDQDLVIASDERGAERKALSTCSAPLRDLDDYDFVIVKLGQVRPKKEVQEVKIVEDS